MSLVFLSLACLPGTLAAVLELPVRFQNGYAMVDVDVGTPGVTHSLLFDTGSSTTWINAASCNATNCPNNSGYNRTGYDPAASSNYHDLGTSASIGYLGGLIVGEGVGDIFSIPSVPNITWDQTFMSVNQSSWFNIPSDGFLGMAFNTITDANTSTLVETLMEDGLLDEPRFGLYYGKEFTDTGGVAGNGTLTLGGSHEEMYVEGAMNWANLSFPDENAQLWRVNMQYLVSIAMPESNSTTPTGTRTTVPLGGTWGVFDTGGGRISIPDPYAETIYASMGMNYSAIMAGEEIPLCKDFTDDWSITFNFGSPYTPTSATLTGTMLKTPGFANGGDEYCWPPFDVSGSDGLFLFGSDFLHQFYTVFDFGGFEPADYTARFGFGTLKEEYRPN